MNVGDIKLETVTSAKTGVTTTVEHIVTQEEVDAYNEQVAKTHKLDLENKIKELDNIINPFDEERRENGEIALERNMELAYQAKKYLKNELETLTGEPCEKCIDKTKLNKDDTTELFLRGLAFRALKDGVAKDVIISNLTSRIEALEGGI